MFPKKALLILLFFYSFTSQSGEKQKWELLSHNDGITVHRDTTYSAGVIPVKASMLVPNSMEEIVAVVLDTNRKAKWAPRVPAVTILKKKNPFDIVEYAQLAFPWPFSDRYFIIRSFMEASLNKDKVSFKLYSIDHQYTPKDKKYVRGHVYNGGMDLEKIGDKIKVTAHLFTDPKGSIPKWVVNMFSKTTSVKFMKALRKQIDKKIYDGQYLEKISKYIQTAAKVNGDVSPLMGDNH